MSKIIGVTVGTPTSPQKMEQEIHPVKTVNGVDPDENGNVNVTINYITPQMFGAVGDGVADDTDAVQAAFDNGGYIYFPAGRYKTTRLLTVSKSCRIEMFKQYPNTYKAEYPLTPSDNWMGARIDTYSPNGGMVIGDAVEVDGLYIRAMEGFQGVVLKFDNTIGTYTYPAAARLRHIKLEIDSPNTVPVSMFDFLPDGSYHYILEDICLGRNGEAGYCEYGFRSDLSQTSREWAYNVTIRNLCIDLHADYPLYIAGGAKGLAGWLFELLTIQAYAYASEGNVENNISRRGHTNLLTLKNAGRTTFISSYLWDVGSATVLGEVIHTENVGETAVIGCSGHFDAIESYLSPWMKRAENLNIANLEMSVEDSKDGTANTLKLFDGANEKEIDIPKVEMSDEQIGNAIGTWMDANAEPREVPGKNKFNPTDPLCVCGQFYKSASGTMSFIPAEESDTTHWVTGYIEAKQGDLIRMTSRLGSYNPLSIACLNDGNEIIDVLSDFGYDNLSKGCEVTADGTVRIRLSINFRSGMVYSARMTDQICVTINNADMTYEDYYTELVGGIGSFMALQSPNGTKYTLSVTDDGVLVAVPAT